MFATLEAASSVEQPVVNQWLAASAEVQSASERVHERRCREIKAFIEKLSLKAPAPTKASDQCQRESFTQVILKVKTLLRFELRAQRQFQSPAQYTAVR